MFGQLKWCGIGYKWSHFTKFDEMLRDDRSRECDESVPNECDEIKEETILKW